MEHKKIFFSIERCSECVHPDERCFSLNLVTHEHNLCIRAKVREMWENWTCDDCGAKLGLQDSRHRIPLTPKKELARAREKLRRSPKKKSVPVKPYLEIKVMCERCYSDLPDTIKAREIFGPDN